MQTWTDQKVRDAVRVIEASVSLDDAQRLLGVSGPALRAGFQRARERGLKVGTPGDHVGRAFSAPIKLNLESVSASTMGVERVLVCPDVHVPFHDVRAWETFLLAAEAYKPDTLVLLGDFVDCYEVSEFTKDPARKHNFASELEAGRTERARIDRLGIKSKKYLLGNHEDRLNRLIAKRAPELHGITSIPQLLQLEENGWDWFEYGEQIQIGDIHFAHDYGPSGSRAVAQSLAATGHCVIFGHTHRAVVEYSGTTDGKRHVGASMGWLGDYDSLAFAYSRRWKARKEWTQGFGTVEIERATGFGSVQFHPIIKGTVMLDGKMVRA